MGMSLCLIYAEHNVLLLFTDFVFLQRIQVYHLEWRQLYVMILFSFFLFIIIIFLFLLRRFVQCFVSSIDPVHLFNCMSLTFSCQYTLYLSCDHDDTILVQTISLCLQICLQELSLLNLFFLKQDENFNSFLFIFSSLQQLDEVAVSSKNAKRLFHGVQGDKLNQGELFGVRNMFSLRTGNTCLTMDIIQVQWKIAIAKNVRNYFLELASDLNPD